MKGFVILNTLIALNAPIKIDWCMSSATSLFILNYIIIPILKNIVRGMITPHWVVWEVLKCACKYHLKITIGEYFYMQKAIKATAHISCSALNLYVKVYPVRLLCCISICQTCVETCKTVGGFCFEWFQMSCLNVKGPAVNILFQK